MWMQDDSGVGHNWEEALDYAENLEFAGHNDWRLPDAKELQSIVDYTRSPSTSNSAAIDPVFNTTAITDEGGDTNYPFYWTGTTHANWSNASGAWGVYVAFGEGLGWMQGPFGGNYTLMDVHGAGSQRSDPKSGDPDDYPNGNGPQGDVVRVYNFARAVRTADTVDVNASPTADAGGPYTGDEASPVTLDASGSSDVDGTLVNYEWDLDNDGEYDDATGVTAEFSAATAGSYTIGLRVTDSEGAIGTDTAAVTIAGEELPVVTIAATDPDAAEANADTGTFTITRTGSTDGDLAVLLSTDGTATAGDDFATINTVVVIPDGQSSIDVTLTPTDDEIDEPNETVTLTVATDADYQIGAADSATVTIIDNDAASEPPPDDGGDDQLPPPPGDDGSQQRVYSGPGHPPIPASPHAAPSGQVGDFVLYFISLPVGFLPGFTGQSLFHCLEQWMVVADVYGPAPVTLIAFGFKLADVTLSGVELKDGSFLVRVLPVEDRPPAMSSRPSRGTGEGIIDIIVAEIIHREKLRADMVGFPGEADIARNALAVEKLQVNPGVVGFVGADFLRHQV